MESNVTRILRAIEGGADPSASRELLPLVYGELRELARQRLAHEQPGQTLQPTALVHEAYLRLVGGGEHGGDEGANGAGQWDGRGHFFAAAAEAMRRILIDAARRKGADRRGGGWQRVELIDTELAVDSAGVGAGEDLLAVDEALTKLAAHDPQLARIVELRFFAGLTLEQAAHATGVSLRTANRHWTYARAWLRRELDRAGGGKSS